MADILVSNFKFLNVLIDLEKNTCICTFLMNIQQLLSLEALDVLEVKEYVVC